jgi:transcriptional regulator of acetoin/glycerol metabolism
MRMWWRLLDIIAEIAGEEAAHRIAERARLELGAVRLTIPEGDRPKPTDAEIRDALRKHGHRVKLAAAELHVSPSTIYNRLRRPPSKVPKPKEILIR